MQSSRSPLALLLECSLWAWRARGGDVVVVRGLRVGPADSTALPQKIKTHKKARLLSWRQWRSPSVRGCSTPPTTTITPQEEIMMQKRARDLFTDSAFPFGIRDHLDAKSVSEKLLVGERKLLFDALRKSMADQYLEHKRLGNATVHLDDHKKMWYIYFVPASLVGVLSSFISMFVGEIIAVYNPDASSLTLLAAVGIANIISNVLMQPIYVAIEGTMKHIGIRRPVLSAEQLNSIDCWLLVNLAKTFGIGFGSILGFVFSIYIVIKWGDTMLPTMFKGKAKNPHYARTTDEYASLSYKETEKDMKSKAKQS